MIALITIISIIGLYLEYEYLQAKSRRRGM
jgi:hypothetical protein